MADRDPRFDVELRQRALASYRRHKSYRLASEELGLSVKRTHELVKDALRLEMDAALEHEGSTTNGS